MLRTISVVSILLLLTACLGLPPVPVSAKLFDADNRLVGFVDLLETRGGVTLRVHTLGLAAGAHGFNLHVHAVCEPPSFATAGPILAPPRRGPADSVALGNLPDISTLDAQWSDTSFAWAGLELNAGERGVFHNGGTSFVITSQPDASLPAPGTGDRIACGTITPRPEIR
ncbi:MAG: superoxide dismutase family protein [Gemmatimonadota bacterium]